MKITKLSIVLSALAFVFFFNGVAQNEEISLKTVGANLAINAPKGTKVSKKEAGADSFTKKYSIKGNGVSLVAEEILMMGNTTLPVIIKRNKNASGIGSYSVLEKETENGYIYKSTDENPAYDFTYFVVDGKTCYSIYNENAPGTTLSKEQAEKLFEMAKTAKIVK